MAGDLIVPDQLPRWVPGRLTVHSPEAGWDGMSVRGYRYAGSDVEVPPMRDYLIVAYRRGQTSMRRRIDSAWIHEMLGPGDVSLLTRAAESHWMWPEDIEVVHVYLTHDEIADICRQIYERDVTDVELHNVVKADDLAIHRTAMLIANEAAQGGAEQPAHRRFPVLPTVGAYPAPACARPAPRQRRRGQAVVQPGTRSPRIHSRALAREHLARRSRRIGRAQPLPLRPPLPSVNWHHTARICPPAAGRTRQGTPRPDQHGAARYRVRLRVRRPEPHDPRVQEAGQPHSGPVPGTKPMTWR